MSRVRRIGLSLILLGAVAPWLSSQAWAVSIGWTDHRTGVRVEPREPRNPDKPTGRLCLDKQPCRDLYAPETCFEWAHKREKWFGSCYFLDGYEVVWNPLSLDPAFCNPCNGGGSRATYHSSSFAGTDHRKLDLSVTEDVQCAEPEAICRPLPIGTLAPDTLSEIAGLEGEGNVKPDETDIYLLKPDEAAAPVHCPPAAL